MKRLFKFMVATLTALSMLVANTSLTSVAVMADGEETAGLYTLSNSIEGEDDVISFSDGTTTFSSNSFDPQSDGGKYFPAGTITVTLTETDHVKDLIVKLDGTTIEAVENVCTISTGFRVVGFQINQAYEGILELVTENPPANNPDEGGDNPGEGGNNPGEGGDNPGEGGEGGNTPVSTGYTFTSVITGSGDQAREDLCFINGTDQVFDGSGTVYQKGSINVDVNEEGNINTLRIITIAGGNTDEIYNSNDGTGIFTANENFKINRIYNDNGVGTLDISFIDDNSDTGNENGNNDNPQITITVTINSGVNRNIGFNCNGHVEGQILLANRTEPYEVTLHEMPDSFSIWMPGETGAEGLRRLKEVYINDVKQKVTARYDDCTFSLEGVTLGENNTIKIDFIGDDTPGGVIEWTNCGCPVDDIQPNIKRAREEFKNGSARVVGIYAKFEDIGNPDKNIIEDYGVEDTGALFDEYNGCLRIENGYWIAFEFTPLPGYQLVEFGGTKPGQLGSDDIKTRNQEANVYYFQMPEGNCHFNAVFDDPANIVEVEDGSIVASSGSSLDVNPENFPGGTAKVTVDTVDADEQNKYSNDNAFINEVEENDLEVQEYLSLDLSNIYQKANTDDYWVNDYGHKTLDKGAATVTLKVDGKFNPDNNKVYIVHDKSDGTFETIEAEYDPNRHEISFETGSFSNFMIATSGEENDIAIDPNYNGDDENNNNVPPEFSIALDEFDEPALGNWEGEDNPFFVPMEIGRAIPGDSVIHNTLPDDLSSNVLLIYYIDGEEVGCFNMDERELTFTPEHFVVYEGARALENSFEVFFTTCWVVGINVEEIDLSMTALDKNGKAIKPIGDEKTDGTVIFECSGAGRDDFTYYEIPYAECPAEVVVKGINGFAIYDLESNEKDALSTPIGDNKIKYSAEEDYMFIGASGMYHKAGEVVTFVDEEFTAVFEGLSEEEAANYIIVVDSLDIESMDDPRIAKYKAMIEEAGYTDVYVGGGFDIRLYDKNGIVHDPGFKVTITVELVNNDEEIELEDGQELMFLHILEDGGYELLKATYDAKANTITFTTSSFSPFLPALGTQVTTTPAAVVSTGERVDSTRIIVASLAIAGAAATGLYLIRKKEETEEEDPTI